MPPCAPTILADALPARRILGPTVHLPSQVDPLKEFTNFTLPEDELETFLHDQCKRVNWNEESNSMKINTRKAGKRAAEGVKSRGPYKRKYQYSIKYSCDHSGAPDSRVLAPLDPNRKRQRTNNKPSIKTDCFAHFWVRKSPDKDHVDVEFHPHHNHETGTPAAMVESRMSKETREWLRGLAQRGFQWSSIKPLLRLSLENDLQLDADGSGSIPQGYHVGWQDAYNYIRREIVKASRLDHDGWASLSAWKTKLEGSGWRVFMEKNIVGDDEPTWAFGLINEWQAQRLHQYGQLVCMDSTHNTAFSLSATDEEKAFLYTLVVKSRETGKGVPVCWMFTPRETRHPIVAWLKWLQRQFDSFRPIYFMLDCSVTEAAAVEESFVVDDIKGRPKPKILWCWFHLFKAVRAKASKIADSPQDATALFSQFMELVEVKSETAFDLKWLELCIKHGTSSLWIKYLVSFAHRHRDRWSRPWREDLPYGIHTNNLIEKWHAILKMHYLQMFRSQRSDFLVLVLTDCVLPDFVRAENRIRLGFEQRRMDKAEKDRARMANAIEIDIAQDMVSIDTREQMHVTSFTNPEVEYDIGRLSEKVLFSCSCPDHSLRGMICKHLQLASRISGYNISTASFVPAPSSDQPPSSDPFAPTLSNSARPRPTATSPSQGDHDTASKCRQLAEKLEQIRKFTSGFETVTPEEVVTRRIDGNAVENALSHAESIYRSLKSQNQPLYASQRPR